MKYNELILKRQKHTTRAGRGIAAGKGKTAGRGTKGQGARKSGGVRPGFEGGQMPLYMRIPKLRGFKSHRALTKDVYTGQLDAIKKTIIDTTVLAEAGLISNPYVRVKLITKGDLKTHKDVKLQAASMSARKAVEQAGGTLTITQQLARAKKTRQ
ncbi:MAG: 50S ribosomal protein L15 [Candidatus Saccharimonadales bacterium]|jgi:large subunit ribosomal protein L15